jgi:hypothetical protein
LKNSDVIKAFLSGKYASTTNLHSYGDKLINYNTVIAEHTEAGLVINTSKYSVSTSKIQNVLLKEADQYIRIDGLSYGVQSLLYHLERR